MENVNLSRWIFFYIIKQAVIFVENISLCLDILLLHERSKSFQYGICEKWQFQDMFSQSFFSLHVQSRIGQLGYNLIAHPTFLGYNKKI